MKKILIFLMVAFMGCSTVPNTTSIITDSQAGALSFDVKPRDAKVFVDGEFVGLSKYFDGEKRRINLAPGEHLIELRRDGYKTISRRVYMSDTQEHFNYDMTPTDGGDFVVRT